MRIVLYIFGALVLMAVALFAWAFWYIQVPPIETKDQDLAQSLETWFEERHSKSITHFNGAALVIHDGQTVLRGAWGKDGEGRELTTDSQFRLASVSKSFTAAAVLKLAQDGLVDLDLPVSEQVEQCPMQATPAELLRHVSGIDDNYFAKADPQVITTVSSVFEGVCESVEGAQAPAEYSYNNTGYVFLAGLVERKSGMSFERYLASELLEPLGLTRTRVWNLVSEDEFGERAITFDDSGPLMPTNLDGVAGDGAVFSTIDDLANWARFWRDDRLISQELKNRATGKEAGDGYHFGLSRDGDIVWHNGSWLGARTYLGFKDTGDGGDVVILLDNGSSLFIGDMASEVWQALK